MADSMNRGQFRDYLKLLNRFLKLNPRQQTDIEAELLDHLAERLADLATQGHDPNEAMSAALGEFGDAAALAAEFTAISKWKRRRHIMRLTYGSLATSLAAVMLIATFWPSGTPSPLSNSPAMAQAEEETSDESVIGTLQSVLEPAAVPADNPFGDDPFGGDPFAGEPAPATTRDRNAVTTDKLARTIVSIDFREAPLIEVIRFLADEADFQSELDIRALDGVGMDGRIPVTRQLKNLSVKTMFWFILRDLDLTYALKEGVVIVTTRDEAERINAQEAMTQVATASTTPKDSNTATAEILAESVISVEFMEDSLFDVMAFLKNKMGLQIQLDIAALNQVGIDARIPITRQLDNLSADTVLWFLLRDLGLTYALKDGVVIVTTPDVAEEIDPRWTMPKTGLPVTTESVGPDAITADKLTKKVVTGGFVDQPLTEVMAILADFGEFQYCIDSGSLEAVGLTSDEPVNLQLEGVSIDTLLWFVLRDLDLTYVLREGVVFITTQEAAEMMLETEIYPIGEFQGQDFEQFVEILTTCVDPSSWAEVGGPGDYQVYRNVLIVRQSNEAHRQLDALLTKLRTATEGWQPVQATIYSGSISNGAAVQLSAPTLQPTYQRTAPILPVASE